MRARKLVTILAGTVSAYHSCIASGNDYADKHETIINALVRDHMPSGSGFDHGTILDLPKSTGEKLVFFTSFHHMNEAGYYDGWTDHNVTVRASLRFGFDVLVSGKNKNEIKDYIAECFQSSLGTILENDNTRGTYRRQTGDGSAEFPFAA